MSYMSDTQTNYRTVNVPDDVPASEYSYVQRRAEILELVEGAGNPHAITQSRLAERYGVSQPQISKDLKRLREYVRETLGQQRHIISESLYRKALKEYADRGEYDKAIEALESWNEWLREEGARDTEPEEQNVNVDASDAYAQLVGAASAGAGGHDTDGSEGGGEADGGDDSGGQAGE